MPYSVMTPRPIVPQDADLGLNTRNYNYTFSITTYGVVREQIEDLALAAQSVILEWPKFKTESGLTLDRFYPTQLGGIGYTTNMSPTAYSVIDIYSCAVSSPPKRR